jgi:hypothetical protein
MVLTPNMRKFLMWSAISLAVAAGVVFLWLPGYLESSMNAVLHKPPYHVSARAADLARRIPVVDLHADSLLWSRDLLQRGSRGQVDIPRLIEGHVALQAFTVVTKTPRGINFQRNTGDTDNILPSPLSSGGLRRRGAASPNARSTRHRASANSRPARKASSPSSIPRRT